MPYLTPQTLPSDVVCRTLRIPNDLRFIAAVQGALDELGKAYNWEQTDGISAQETADRALAMVYEEQRSQCLDMIGAVFPSIVGLVPDNWLLLDGAWWPIADYPILYQRMLGTWSSNETHFQLPDLSGRFVMGPDGEGPLGFTGGLASVTLTEQQLPVVTVTQQTHGHQGIEHTHTQVGHNHTYYGPTFNIDVEGPGAPDPTGAGFPNVPYQTDWRQPEILPAAGSVQPTKALNNPFGGGQAHENRPPFIRLEYYVVAR